MPETTTTFDGELSSVGDARHFVQQVLADWGANDCVTEASLLITELATNSVIHAKSPFDVTMALDEGGLRISVTDHSPRLPLAKSYSMKATTGRGLRLVAAYAEAWGVEPHRSGKTVWCTLSFNHERGTGPAEASKTSGTSTASLKRAGAAPSARAQARPSAKRSQAIECPARAA